VEISFDHLIDDHMHWLCLDDGLAGTQRSEIMGRTASNFVVLGGPLSAESNYQPEVG
jgi:hypothetical protein